MTVQACRFVPTKRISSPLAASFSRKWHALMRPLTVSRTSMMWMRLRRAKMYGAIFGFHRLTLWPKWTPATRRDFGSMNVDGIRSSKRVSRPARAPKRPDAKACAPVRPAPVRLPTGPWAPRAARRSGGLPAEGILAAETRPLHEGSRGFGKGRNQRVGILGGAYARVKAQGSGLSLDQDLVGGPVQAVDDEHGHELAVLAVQLRDLVPDRVEPLADLALQAVDLPGDAGVIALDGPHLVEERNGEVGYVGFLDPGARHRVP